MDAWRGSWGLAVPSPPRNFSDCPRGIEWVWNAFGECASDGRDLASVVLGLFSILCFVAASFPQYFRSCKTGNMDEALSIWFLLGWLAGDTCNFVGAFLSNQLPIQTYTAIYYVLADIFMLSLYMYYKYRNQRTSCEYTSKMYSVTLYKRVKTSNTFRPRTPISLMTSESVCVFQPFTTQEIIGCAIGSVSSMFYLISRLPQIITNFRRRSTEGLALSLFCMVIVGNLTYGLSILLKNPDKDQSEANYIEHHLPWLIGSLGVMSLDCVIIFQFFVFGAKRPDVGEPGERDPLLHGNRRAGTPDK
ncbi:PREDICTED: lysosomal amino acid transporter 1 homolog [Nanorana parkeri]|uniref:lysosomal amino acid transporter 1 homolog n=1 Tax=Nanorana parkeri TaxID=125878 RepID=UPI000854CA33|nr:PREDICTED: lysosomal amino acid transporter 1 homolog [Nanorana parkeri]